MNDLLCITILIDTVIVIPTLYAKHKVWKCLLNILAHVLGTSTTRACLLAGRFWNNSRLVKIPGLARCISSYFSTVPVLDKQEEKDYECLHIPIQVGKCNQWYLYTILRNSNEYWPICLVYLPDSTLLLSHIHETIKQSN